MIVSRSAHPPRRRRDKRLIGLVIVVLATALLGYLVTLLPAQQVFQVSKQRLDNQPPPHSPTEDATLYPPLSADEEGLDLPLRARLGEIHEMLIKDQHEAAYEALNAQRESLQQHPASLVLMGEALLGKAAPATALDFFNAALNRDPTLADAYFGAARAAEALGDLELALSGMRSYLHLQDNPYQLRVAQARSAIWEWEAKLERGPWGPTKGIPPGFTADELKRDGRGAGTKVPIPGTENERGNTRYEIRYSDKFELFEQ